MKYSEFVIDPKLEWLETDGQGGYALGTSSLLRTRRYHGWYSYASKPPVERHGGLKHVELICFRNDVECYRTPASFRTTKDSEGIAEGTQFFSNPWPTWRIALDTGLFLIQEYLIVSEKKMGVFFWHIEGSTDDCFSLELRPFVSERDHHHLGTASLYDWSHEFHEDSVHLQYQKKPFPLSFTASGNWKSSPIVYQDFYYEKEEVRGYDSTEDLFSPGYYELTLDAHERSYVLVQQGKGTIGAQELYTFCNHEKKKRSDPYDFRSGQFIVESNERSSIVAGYPWFTDWGRDTFISLRGLCLETGRVQLARDILCAWAQYIDKGMIPNRFPDESEAEYNSVDASLWYVVSAYAYLDLVRDQVRTTVRRTIEEAIDAILEGYMKGTRYNIGCDDDGLMYAGEIGYALTWMDARFEGRAITPRIGKPVEIQALWLNALAMTAQRNSRYEKIFNRGKKQFQREFYCAEKMQLYDVIDVEGSSRKDDAFRPNQLFALGGLPFSFLDSSSTEAILLRVDQELLTPFGLRTLSPNHPAYCPRYEGSLELRDAAYHQGTVWPWLIGAYIESSLKVGRSAQRLRTALHQLQRVFSNAGAGMTPEVYDASEPQKACGCPFQAWSLAEFLRASRLLEIS